MSGDRADLRLSDAEREDAMEVLGEHVRTGRIDIEEFGTRSAKINAAKKVSELRPLFEDLPSPRPSVLITGAARPAGTKALSSRFTFGTLPAVAVVAVGVLVLTRFWPVAIAAGLIVFVLLVLRRH